MNTPELNDLLARWKDAYRKGQDLPATAFCPDRPEDAGQLQSAIDLLRSRITPAAPVSERVDRMMRWHGRAVALVATILGVAFLYGGVKYLQIRWEDAGGPGTAGFLQGAEAILGWAGLALLVPLAACALVIVWQVFRAGSAAFGVGAGLGYVVLTVLLLWGPGIFVIPHMVRLDVRRAREEI